MGLGTRRRDQLPRWAQDPLWTAARAVPSLDLRFTANRSLRDHVSGAELITFTRASSATVIGPTGTIETVSNDVPRFQHDPVTGRCLGLLAEEQRINLLLNSATLSTQSVTSAATAYTLSFYGTGTITLSGTSTAGPLVGTAANQRVSLTFTPTAGTLTLTVSGSVTNANLEAGSFATSWIPTTGTSATRSADIATITGTAFSGWYNQGQGTWFAEYTAAFDATAAVAGNLHLFQAYNAAAITNNYCMFENNSGTANDASQGRNPTVGVVRPAILSIGIRQRGVTYRRAFAIDAATLQHSTNGLLSNSPANTVAALMATHDSLLIGSGTGGSGNFQLSSPISRLTFWPQRLPNHILQALTR
jgi:hypothetical protein